MAIGTPNPDFNAEAWCDTANAAPEPIIVQMDVSELPPEIPAQQ